MPTVDMYYDLGYDPAKGRYGIPLREHPDYRDAAKKLAATAKALREQSDRHLVEAMAWFEAHPEANTTYGPERDPELVALFARQGEESKGLRAEQRAIVDPLVKTNLYRWDGGMLSVRYDRVGKHAWEAELKRLGRK